MILPERVLGRSSAQMMRFGPRELADLLADVLAQLDVEALGRVAAALHRHEGDDRLAGRLVGLRHDRGLGHALV